MINLVTPFTYTKYNDIMCVWEKHINLQETILVNFVINLLKDTVIPPQFIAQEFVGINQW